MQIDGDNAKLRQLEVQVRYWILFELGKEQRLELTILLKPRKSKSPFLEILPAFVQLLDGLLENLGRNFT